MSVALFIEQNKVANERGMLILFRICSCSLEQLEIQTEKYQLLNEQSCRFKAVIVVRSR